MPLSWKVFSMSKLHEIEPFKIYMDATTSLRVWYTSGQVNHLLTKGESWSYPQHILGKVKTAVRPGRQAGFGFHAMPCYPRRKEISSNTIVCLVNSFLRNFRKNSLDLNSPSLSYIGLWGMTYIHTHILRLTNIQTHKYWNWNNKKTIDFAN